MLQAFLLSLAATALESLCPSLCPADFVDDFWPSAFKKYAMPHMLLINWTHQAYLYLGFSTGNPVQNASIVPAS